MRFNKRSVFPIVFSLLSFVANHVAADNHALIMGISGYARSPLDGVPKDRESARKIAKAMGVPDENVVERKEKELTLDGLRAALKDFEKKIRPGDRAFIYFSGHGSSRSNGKGGCEQSIVTQEIGFMPKTEFHDLISPIQERASKTIVFLDTCFSGGVVSAAKDATRAFDDSPLKPKFLISKFSSGQDDTCGNAENYAKATRDFDDIKVAQSTPNYYMLGAAGPNEYAIDGGASAGGFATSAFLHCLSPSAGADVDNDGIVSLEEATRCAQRRVNSMLRPPFLAQTLTEGSGNGAGATPVAFGFGDSSLTTVAASGAVAQPAATRINSQQLLETIRRNSDQKHTVKIKSGKRAYKIKQDYLDLEVVSGKSGYLTLLSVGSSGKIFQLFPNDLDRNNHIDANAPLKLPRPEWRVPSGGPAGTNRFLAVVSGVPDRFANLEIPVGGRFKAFDATAVNAKEIMKRLVSPAPGCNGQTPTRDFDSPEGSPCGSSYGAGMVDVLEVE